jgi:hypothetical protein
MEVFISGTDPTNPTSLKVINILLEPLIIPKFTDTAIVLREPCATDATRFRLLLARVGTAYKTYDFGYVLPLNFMMLKFIVAQATRKNLIAAGGHDSTFSLIMFTAFHRSSWWKIGHPDRC